MSLLRRKSRNSEPDIPLGQNWPAGRWLLFAISFTAVAVSMGSVVWASGQSAFIGAMLAAAALGHLLSAAQVHPRFRLSYVIYPIALLVVFTMRADLLGVLGGGALLPLARFLVVIQAMASFNLRSMRTLYDTLLLGLVVVLIASEGALSIAFLIFPLVFGVVALLFLVTAHLLRETQRARWVRSPGPLGVVSVAVTLVVLTFSAGLAVFLLMPQPYRVVNAHPLPSRVDLTSGRPVTSLDLDGGDSAPWSQFLPSRDTDGVSGSAADGQSGDDLLNALDADLNLSPEELGYATLGYQGEPSPDVVMYVRSPLASYWRGQILDEYDGLGWKSSGDTLQLVTDKKGKLRFADTPYWFDRVRSYVQSFYLQVPQPDSVFTGYSPGLIVVPDPASEGEPMEIALENLARLKVATSYRIVSAIPGLDPELLQLDSADTEQVADLYLPSSVTVRTKALADSIVQGASSDYEKVARLEAFLLENYSYDLRVSPFTRSGDVVDRFLFERQAGYCAQFATTMAVMARTVGLPARVVIGYLPGGYNSLTGVHEVRVQDAHAWVEVKFERYGWVPFDPTPRPDSPFATDIGYAGATAGLQQILRAQFGDIVQGSSSAVSAGVTSLFGGPGMAGLFMVLGSLALAIAIRFRRLRWTRSRRTRGYTRLTGGGREHVMSVYRKALRTLERKGYPRRQSHQAPGDYLAHLEAEAVLVPIPFRDLTHRADAALYDPRSQDSLLTAAVAVLIKPLRKLPRLG